MTLSDRLRSLLTRPKIRRGAAPSAFREFAERSRLVTALIFIATVAAIVYVSSAGVSIDHLPVLPNQVATVRIVAGASFTYESAERTRLARARLAERLPPVYRLEQEHVEQFAAALGDLLAALAAHERSQPGPGRTAGFAAIAADFEARGPYRANPEDLILLAETVPTETRADIFTAGLDLLRDIHREGVQDTGFGVADDGGVAVVQIIRPDGEVGTRPVQSLEEALTYLRINLAAENVSREVSLAAFRLLRNGIKPNLVFDREATRQRAAATMSSVAPVTVTVLRGQPIIERGTRVTPEQHEMLMAHRQFLLENADTQLDEGLQLFGRILLVLAMVIASVFYVRLEDRETFQSNSRLGLLALVVILNLALVRAVYSLGAADFFPADSTWTSVLPYVAPSALAPLIVAILIDAGSGIFMALLISIFTGVIYGNRLDVIVITFLASMVAIFAGHDVRRRSRVVRAAGLGGLTVALFALLVGLADQSPVAVLLHQMGAGVVSGLFTGVVVVGLLPVLEALFKRTTDITLLELTDFNHPLLRRMQLAAPGSYHHSLVVAQLAENACGAIGANPLLARVCALFHDIGKTRKPEYFIENQRDRANPHDASNPSLSALIIKSHVKDGVELAQQHHLPRAIIDVIQQHHGTSLISYFYHRARQSTAEHDAPAVEETTYRYDGPRPQFRESAVICLADGIEAASRTLRKITPQHVGELIEIIVHDRIEDGQLDECPLTIGEIALVKRSFASTLINMLHARIDYPSGESTPVAPKA
jgi:putative nucleotidyltransferase with HDIG domain